MPPKVDPTHFHPTTPHASSRIEKTPGPPGETPQEKVRRLREVAARARDAKISRLDKFLVHGRLWADRIHRTTTLSLIGITVVAGVITVYTLTDMMIHNRRKKHEFMIEQKHVHLAAVSSARAAMAAGTATPEQIMFMETEDKLDRIEAERRNRPGPLTKGKQWLSGKLFSGMKREETTVSSESEILKAVDELKEELGEALVTTKGAFQETAGKIRQDTQDAWEKEKKLEREGGLLDQVGLTEECEKPKNGGWTSWMGRG